MIIKVGINEISVVEQDLLNAGEYNIHECNFIFDEVYEGLVKKALFTNKTNTYQVSIVNNSCIIPYEVLQEKSVITIGVYAYEVQDEELIMRYSPKPCTKYIDIGSYKEHYDNYEEVTPTDKEQIEQAITDLQDGKVDKVEGKELSTNDFTDEYKSQVDSNTIARHTHNNKTLLDGISNTDITNWNNKAEISDIPTNLSQLNEDSAHRLVTDTEKNTWNNKSDFSGNYNDLTNKPNIPTKTSDLTNDNGFIDKTVNDLTNYTLKTNTGSLIDLEINQSTYVITLKLKNQDGTVISTDTVDFPLESVVVGGSYDSVNKKIVLTLENGNTVDIPVGDLIAGLQTEITSNNQLASDLVDDSNSGNKFVTTSDKSNWNGKYDKPVGGIPKTDLDSSVQTSLGKADTAIQDTDYASYNKAGVIKTNEDAYGVGINASGYLHGATSTYQNYQNKSTLHIISKGTLENVIEGKQLVNKAYVDELIGDINTLLDTLNRVEV